MTHSDCAARAAGTTQAKQERQPKWPSVWRRQDTRASRRLQIRLACHYNCNCLRCRIRRPPPRNWRIFLPCWRCVALLTPNPKPKIADPFGRFGGVSGAGCLASRWRVLNRFSRVGNEVECGRSNRRMKVVESSKP